MGTETLMAMKKLISIRIPELKHLCDKLYTDRFSKWESYGERTAAVEDEMTFGDVIIKVTGCMRAVKEIGGKIVMTGIGAVYLEAAGTSYTYCGEWAGDILKFHTMSCDHDISIECDFISINPMNLHLPIKELKLIEFNGAHTHILAQNSPDILVPLRPDQDLLFWTPDGQGLKIEPCSASTEKGKGKENTFPFANVLIVSITREIFARDKYHNEVLEGTIRVDCKGSEITWRHLNNPSWEHRDPIKKDVILNWCFGGFMEPNIFRALSIEVPAYKDP